MKTTVDIPAELLAAAMRYSGAASEREAVVQAVEEFNRRHRQADLIKHLGTFEDFISQDELEEIRASRVDRNGVD